MPINIKKTRIHGRFAVLENVQPPGIVAAHHSHVVGHDVEYQSHAMFMESSHKAFKVLGAADLRVERVVIDDVVAVHTAGTSL